MRIFYNGNNPVIKTLILVASARFSFDPARALMEADLLAAEIEVYQKFVNPELERISPLILIAPGFDAERTASSILNRLKESESVVREKIQVLYQVHPNTMQDAVEGIDAVALGENRDFVLVINDPLSTSLTLGGFRSRETLNWREMNGVDTSLEIGFAQAWVMDFEQKCSGRLTDLVRSRAIPKRV